MGHDGFVAPKNRGFALGKQSFSAILDKAPIINGQRVVFRSTCKTSNVWTTKKMQDLCRKNSVVAVPFFHKHVMEEQPHVRYDSSSSDESPSTAALQCQVAVERCRREKELTLSDGKVSRKG